MRLVIASKDKYIFKAIQDGSKKVETRAVTTNLKNIKKGDVVTFACAGKTLLKSVSNVQVFKTVDELLKTYKPQDINPKLTTKKEIEQMYYSFTGYKEKIKEFGIITFELK